MIVKNDRELEHSNTPPTSSGEAIGHCLEKIRTLVGSNDPGRRDLLQLGYNLGRLSELTGGGRGPFWDRWKGPASTWDRAELRRLALELHDEFTHTPIVGSARLSDQHESGPAGPDSDLAP